MVEFRISNLELQLLYVLREMDANKSNEICVSRNNTIYITGNQLLMKSNRLFFKLRMIFNLTLRSAIKIKCDSFYSGAQVYVRDWLIQYFI